MSWEQMDGKGLSHSHAREFLLSCAGPKNRPGLSQTPSFTFKINPGKGPGEAGGELGQRRGNQPKSPKNGAEPGGSRDTRAPHKSPTEDPPPPLGRETQGTPGGGVGNILGGSGGPHLSDCTRVLISRIQIDFFLKKKCIYRRSVGGRGAKPRGRWGGVPGLGV